MPHERRLQPGRQRRDVPVYGPEEGLAHLQVTALHLCPILLAQAWCVLSEPTTQLDAAQTQLAACWEASEALCRQVTFREEIFLSQWHPVSVCKAMRMALLPQVHGAALGDAGHRLLPGSGLLPHRVERGHHRLGHQPRPVPVLPCEPSIGPITSPQCECACFTASQVTVNVHCGLTVRL